MIVDDESVTLKQLLRFQNVDWNAVKHCVKCHPDQVTDKRLREIVQKHNVPNDVIHFMLEAAPGGVSYKTLKRAFFHSQPQNHLELGAKKALFSHSSLMIALGHECGCEESCTNSINIRECIVYLRSRFARRRLSNLLFSYGCDRARKRLEIDDFIAKMHDVLMVCPHVCYKTIVRNCTIENMRDVNDTMACMKRLIHYLLHDAPEKIKRIAREQLDYDVLLEIAEEPWLLRFLVSIYPDCLHTKDDCDRFLLYDLALYNCELLENFAYILQKGIELKVDGDHAMMAGLMSKPNPKGNCENAMTAMERILCRDFYWDEQYKTKVLHVAMNIAEKNGIKINLIKMAIDLRVNSSSNVMVMTSETFERIVNIFSSHALHTSNTDSGRLALHHAIAKKMKWEDGLHTLLSVSVNFLDKIDGVTGLYPFMLAASSPTPENSVDVDLTSIYYLLRPNPALVFTAMKHNEK